MRTSASLDDAALKTVIGRRGEEEERVISQVSSRRPLVLLAYGIATEGHSISADSISGGKWLGQHSHCQMDVGKNLVAC
jgi:hypothetical protein